MLTLNDYQQMQESSLKYIQENLIEISDKLDIDSSVLKSIFDTTRFGEGKDELMVEARKQRILRHIEIQLTAIVEAMNTPA